MSNSMVFGDCLLELPLIPSRSIDMILCDLPYGITACKWDSVIPLEALWGEFRRVIKPSSVIALTASQPFTSELVMSNPKMFKYSMVWRKTQPTGHLNAKKRPMRAHEDILVFSDGVPVYYPQKTTGHARKISTAGHKRGSKKTDVYGDHGLTGYDSTERYPTTILTYSNDKQRSAIHPTQKPVALFEAMIRSYTREGQTVLDCCAGSGTTAIAAINTRRRFIVIEKDEGYFAAMKNRIRAALPPSPSGATEQPTQKENQ